MIAALRSGLGAPAARVTALAFGVLMAAALVLALVGPALAQEQSPPPDSELPAPGQEPLPGGDPLPDGEVPPDGEAPVPDSETPGPTTQQEAPGEGDTPATGVLCQGQLATKLGTDGDDQNLDGTEEADVIVAGDGQDEIDGKGGDDVICGGDGDGARENDVNDDDEVKGGPGSDTINGGSGNDSIDGQGGDDTLFGDDEQTSDGYISTADEIHGGDGDDEIDGRADQDIVRGEDGEDTITSRGDGVFPSAGGEGGGQQAIAIIDVVIGGPGRDDCTADDDDDVSECGDEDGDDDSARDDDGDDGRNNDDDSSGDGGAGTIVGAALPPFCLAQRASIGKRGIGRLFLGGNVVETLVGAGELPLPLPPRRSFSFCIDGGGVTLVAFSPIGRAEVILSTGPGRSAREVNPGDPASAIRRSYPNAVRIQSPATHSGARLYRASPTSRIIFGVRGGRVVFVGMASRMALADGDLLAEYLRQIPLPPAG